MRRAPWFSLLLLVALPACAWWMAGRPGIGASDHLTFSHSFHLGEDIECDQCHEEITEADLNPVIHRVCSGVDPRALHRGGVAVNRNHPLGR